MDGRSIRVTSAFCSSLQKLLPSQCRPRPCRHTSSGAHGPVARTPHDHLALWPQTPPVVLKRCRTTVRERAECGAIYSPLKRIPTQGDLRQGRTPTDGQTPASRQAGRVKLPRFLGGRPLPGSQAQVNPEKIWIRTAGSPVNVTIAYSQVHGAARCRGTESRVPLLRRPRPSPHRMDVQMKSGERGGAAFYSASSDTVAVDAIMPTDNTRSSRTDAVA